MFLSYIPTPSVSTFSIGPLTIHAYALCIITGAVVAIWLTNRRYVAAGGSEHVVGDLAIWVIPGGVIGARLYHVISSPEYFFGKYGNFSNIFKIWEGGLGIWGAIAGGFAVAIWKYNRELPFSVAADAAAPGLLIAQGIGRFGNWFNGELYGRATDLPWALKLNDGHTYHPTFLYEAICNFILAFLLIKISGQFRSGSVFLIYVSGYCLYRFFIEGIRIDEAHNFAGLRLNQWVSLLLGGATFAKFIHLNGLNSLKNRFNR